MLGARTGATAHQLCQILPTTLPMLATETETPGHLLGPTLPTVPITLATRTNTTDHLLCQTHPRDHGTRVLQVPLVILVDLEVALQAAPQATRMPRARYRMDLYSQRNRREREGQRRKRHSSVGIVTRLLFWIVLPLRFSLWSLSTWLSLCY